jgi:hypothetical protein
MAVTNTDLSRCTAAPTPPTPSARPSRAALKRAHAFIYGPAHRGLIAAVDALAREFDAFAAAGAAVESLVAAGQTWTFAGERFVVVGKVEPDPPESCPWIMRRAIDGSTRYMHDDARLEGHWVRSETDVVSTLTEED